MFILIRIHDIDTNPGISFFVDPWKLYSAGHIDFEAKSEYMGHAVRPHISLTEQVQRKEDVTQTLVSPIRGPLRTIQTNGDAVRTEKVMYTWRPLENKRYIRLLLLSKGQGDMDLHGKLEHVSLDDNPKYFAISYAWGSRLKQFTLKTDEGEIPLTMSLYLALRQIRRLKKEIYIWADAICINQDDNEEKANQVRLMQDIFKSAVQVYAWLGPGDLESRLALETLGQIYGLLEPDSVKEAPKSWRPNKIPPVEDAAWVAIKKLFDRKWFRRVWIVQEVILASELTLVCGDVRIHWEDFYQAAKYCDYQASDPRLALVLPENGSQAAVVSLGDFRRSYHEKGAKDMYTLLREFKRTESTNPCDKLFALLSLATDRNIEGFRPDYSSKFRDVVLKYAKVFVEEQGRGMELLHRARLSATADNSDLPSWVPSWTSPTAYLETISTWGGPGHFCAGTHKNAEMEISGDVLSVKGQIVDSLVGVGKSPSTSDVRRYLGEIFTFIDDTYPNKEEERRTLKWKVPIGAATQPPRGDWGDDGGLVSFEAMDKYWALEDQDDNWKREEKKIRFNAAESRPLREAEILAKQLWPYLNTAMDFAEILSPAVACITEAKCVGIVPQTAFCGDVIAVFNGCAVPFLLRKHDRGEDLYQVVGECYMHYLMHGESHSRSGPEKRIQLV